MTTQAILGLDVAQAGVAFQLQRFTGPALATGRAAATSAGWAELTAVLTDHHLTWPETLVVIEATGQWHLPWCEAASAAGATVLALNPLIARRVTAVGNAIRDQKSDPIDAAGLTETGARYAAELTRFTYRSQPGRFGLRRLLSVRADVRTALTNLRKSAGDLQGLCFPELADTGLSADRRRDVLRVAAAPAAVAALDEKVLRPLAAKYTDAVRAAARSSFAPAALTAAAAPALQALLHSDEALAQQLAALDRQISAAAATALDADQLQRAATLPGFGARPTPAILACIPPELFTHHRSHRARANALQALFGCEPRLRTSGQWTGKIKMSKRGIREARTALYQAAFCALAHDPEIKAYYDALRARGKEHKSALVDVMRKLLRRLVAVLDPAVPTPSQKQPCAA